MKINESTSSLPPVATISQLTTPGDTGGADAGVGLGAQPGGPSGPACTLLHPEGQPGDAGRVIHLRQQIADGSYHIDAAEIAGRLITAARELFTRRH
ncbi:MAG: flagellar biosynthesis anti-sigma factor FlgM [Oxalobacteraceae bacterium]